ncbi:MAG TPA: hypothetical protein VGI39_40400, partial [Polyangiaceae bacterium]
RINALAEELTLGVLAAIRSASLEELLAEGGRVSTSRAAAAPARSESAAAAAPARGRGKRPAAAKSGRLPRRSPEQIAEVVESIVGALKKTKTGMRSEQLQKLLKLDKREISGPLNEALAGKKITKKGERRATTYFAR